MDLIPKLPEEHEVYVIVALVAVAIFIPLSLLKLFLKQDRRTALAKFAARHSLSFTPENHPWHEDWYATFDLLARERPREQRNIMMGQWRGLHVAVLDYDYTPQPLEGEEQETARRTVAIVYLSKNLPGIIIEPNVTNRAGARFKGPYPRGLGTLDDLTDEISNFERRYVLLAEDQVAAGQLLHPEMETFLLRHWGIGVEISGTVAVFFAYRVLRPGEIKALLDFAARFCQLIPDSMHTRPEQPLEQGS